MTPDKETLMAVYKVIAGTFHVKGFSPDGDSIRFQAKDQSLWDFFTWEDKSKKDDKRKQLRVESIDAMETHYEGYHQPRTFALAALESLLELIGIKDVVYSMSMTKIVNADDGKAGFIAAASIDPFGRPVSYLFPKSAKLTDGTELESTSLPIEDSINFQLAREGLVYPTFYKTTDRVFAEKIRAVVARARKTKRGIWSIDRTSDFTLYDIRTLQEDILILPKLFRRLVSFFDGYSDFNQLGDYLAKQKDRLELWDGTKKQSLAELMKINGRRIQLKTPPEDILFNPK